MMRIICSVVFSYTCRTTDEAICSGGFAGDFPSNGRRKSSGNPTCEIPPTPPLYIACVMGWFSKSSLFAFMLFAKSVLVIQCDYSSTVLMTFESNRIIFHKINSILLKNTYLFTSPSNNKEWER